MHNHTVHSSSADHLLEYLDQLMLFYLHIPVDINSFNEVLHLRIGNWSKGVHVSEGVVE